MEPNHYLSHGDLPHTLAAGTQHGSQHGTQHGPPRYLSHGDLPHTLTPGNQHGSQHGTQHGPPWYLSHGDLPHTLKAGNQHGSQQNKTPLSVLHEPSLAARLCMCGFGLQPKPTWNPTDILKKHKLNLVMKESYHSSPPMSTFLLAEGLAPTKF